MLQDDPIGIPAGFPIDSPDAQARWVYVYSLPFRIRIGALYRFDVPGESHLIVIRNRPLEYDLLGDGTKMLRIDPVSRFVSDVLIVIDPKSLTPPLSKRGDPRDRHRISTEHSKTVEDAVRLLNDFVVAYDMTVGKSAKMFGCFGYFRKFTVRDLHNALAVKVFSPPGHVLSNEELHSLLDLPRGYSTSRPLEPVDDLSRDLLVELADNYAVCQNDIFHQFVFESRDALCQGDETHALLSACIALEAAHFSLLQSRAAMRSPSIDANKRENIVDALVREAGFSTAVDVTCAFVLDENERPPPETLKAAKAGVQARNAIMHAVRRRGKFKVRNYRSYEFSWHARHVLELVEYFRKAIDLDHAARSRSQAELVSPARGDDSSAKTAEGQD